MSSFTKKILRFSLTLGEGDFGAGTGNTVILQGLRAVVKVEKCGHPSKNMAKVKIYGMKQDDMNALTTTAFQPLAVRKNLIKIEAGDDQTGLSTCFQGNISAAFAAYQEAPDLYFHIEAISGYYPALTPKAPTSFQGGCDVSRAIGALALDMGFAFENNGVDTMLASPYLYGSPWQQAAQLADAANLEFGVDDNTLFIAPRNMSRTGTAPVISKDTGLKEYPIFDKKGVKFDCLYNPALIMGGPVIVKSVVPNANQNWRINGLQHHLESEKPGGAWLSRVEASYKKVG